MPFVYSGIWIDSVAHRLHTSTHVDKGIHIYTCVHTYSTVHRTYIPVHSSHHIYIISGVGGKWPPALIYQSVMTNGLIWLTQTWPMSIISSYPLCKLALERGKPSPIEASDQAPDFNDEVVLNSDMYSFE